MSTEENKKKPDSCVCRRCGRKLRTPESIVLGFGLTCYKKFLAQPIRRPLFKYRREWVIDQK